MLLVVIIAQGIVVDGQCDVFRLTGLEIYLLESFQFLVGALQGALLVVDIELYHFSSCTLALVLDGYR